MWDILQKPILTPTWNAMATVTDESLDVRYNLNMMMSDFTDGVYVRER